LTNLVAITAQDLHALAIRADGSVVAWGSDDFGESRPPSRASNVVAVAGGFSHSLALTRSTPAPWPWVTAQPQSRGAAVNDTVTFDVTAIGLRPFTYRWQYRGQDIPGQTNRMLVLDDLALSQSGDYAVVVSAEGLSVRSAPAASAHPAVARESEGSRRLL
jgi:hypothetical protein